VIERTPSAPDIDTWQIEEITESLESADRVAFVPDEVIKALFAKYIGG
jgi:hypothetical protein